MIRFFHALSKRFGTAPARSVQILLCSSLVVLITGCGSAKEDSLDNHDDEHLMHFVPAHKPTSFAKLVDQLSKRIAELADSWGTQDTTRKQTLRQELSDVIGWIPELAADSELNKADFESAVTAGKALQAEFVMQFTIDSSSATNPRAFESALKSLRDLTEKSQERITAM